MTNLAPVPDPEDEFAKADPHDMAAEQAVLGSMMLSAAAAETCRSALSAEDFYRPAHREIFRHITHMMLAGEAVDPVTLKDSLEGTHQLSQCGSALYLHSLIESVPVAQNAAHYAAIVRDRAVRRRLLAAGRRIIQWGSASEAVGDAHGLTERAFREIEAARNSGLGDGLTVKTFMEFLDVPAGADDYDWVVPGLLEHGDRLVITGAEGAGKSSLLRQLAVTIAAGIHPFKHLPMKPCRVLYIDSENSERQMRRKLRPMLEQAERQHHPVSETNLWLEARGRMDLAMDRDVSWLLRQVTTVRPDVVMLGPLSKLAPRALNNDDDVAPVLAALDMIRERDACLVLEGHAGHALTAGGRRDFRPRGSAALLGWPEFGYGLRWTEDPQGAKQRTVDFVSWRGDRDEREWPQMLTAADVWPWRIYDPVSAGWD